LGVVVPAARINGDEAHADFDQAPRQEQTLPKIVSAILLPDFFVFTLNVESFLRLRRSDEVEATSVELIEGNGWIFGELVREPLHVVQGMAELLASGSAAFADVWRKSHIADFETVAVWVTVDHEWGVLCAQKIGAARARDFRHRDISRQTFSYSPIVRNH